MQAAHSKNIDLTPLIQNFKNFSKFLVLLKQKWQEMKK